MFLSPLGFLTGVVLGSAVSIALVLAMVLVIFALTADGEPALLSEYPGLLAGTGLFAVLAATAAVAFVGLQRGRSWRWLAQGAMWLVLLLVGFYYWPGSRA